MIEEDHENTVLFNMRSACWKTAGGGKRRYSWMRSDFGKLRKPEQGIWT